MLKNLNQPTNIYLLVSDANAPRPLYGVDTSNWKYSDWDVDEKRKKVADSILLAEDSSIATELKDVKT